MKNKEIIKLAKESGIEDLSISRNSRVSITIKYENGFFRESKESIFKGANITSYLNGNRVSRNIDNFDKENIISVLKEIKEMTNYKTKELDEKPLNPKGLEYQEIEPYIFTPPSIQDSKEIIKKIVNQVNASDKRIIVANTSGYFYVSSDSSSLENTEGIKLSSSSGLYFSIFIIVYTKDGNDSEQIRVGRLCRDIKDIDIKDIEEEIKKEIDLKLTKKQIKSGKYEILFDRGVFNSLLENFLSHMNARNIIDKKSVWENKLNKRVASSKVTLIDKPFVKEIGEFRTYDADGYPTKINNFIENGILTSFVHNRKTAKILNQENTGNSKGAIPGLHMLFLEPGQKKDKELFESIQEGIFVTELTGMHSGVNVISGDFSLEFSGNLIKDGKVKEAIKAGVISGNFFKDVFLEVDEVSSEIEIKKIQFQPMVKLSKKLSITV